jgi:hypothetical protein
MPLCIRCGKQLNGKQIKYCSETCKNVSLVNKRQEEMKKKALEYKNGKCEICGYNKCSRALTFHHLDFNKKEFNLSSRMMGRYSWEKVKQELDKCLLLCFNCHNELHDKLDKEKRLNIQSNNI